LKHLYLGSTSIGEGGLSSVVGALSLGFRLEGLSLPGNSLGDGGAKLLANALGSKNKLGISCSLKVINLDGNGISAAGALVLAKAFSAVSELRSLSLSDNQLLDQGISFLCAGLKRGSQIHSLRLQGAGITDIGAGKLATLLEAPSLSISTIRVERNPLTKEGRVLLQGAQAKRDWSWEKERLIWLAAMMPLSREAPISYISVEIARFIVMDYLREMRSKKVRMLLEENVIRHKCPLGIHRDGTLSCSCAPPKPEYGRGL